MKIKFRVMVTVLDGPLHNRVWRTFTHVIVGTLEEAQRGRDEWNATQRLNPSSRGAIIVPEVRA